MDEYLSTLSGLHEVATKLYETTKNKEKEDDVQTVTEQVEALVPRVTTMSEKLGAMHRGFQQQKTVQEHVVFLREVRSRLEVEYCLDQIQDVEKELRILKVCQ
jgi:hypothetical protein